MWLVRVDTLWTDLPESTWKWEKWDVVMEFKVLHLVSNTYSNLYDVHGEYLWWKNGRMVSFKISTFEQQWSFGNFDFWFLMERWVYMYFRNSFEVRGMCLWWKNGCIVVESVWSSKWSENVERVQEWLNVLSCLMMDVFSLLKYYNEAFFYSEWVQI